jgi:hypothetical protein
MVAIAAAIVVTVAVAARGQLKSSRKQSGAEAVGIQMGLRS